VGYYNKTAWVFDETQTLHQDIGPLEPLDRSGTASNFCFELPGKFHVAVNIDTSQSSLLITDEVVIMTSSVN